uniref:L1 transposable element RRM domain-containing protein n=1 Tax=Seriola dumerili TaxID=41447 RepID=A0A3B4UI21_SERDU
MSHYGICLSRSGWEPYGHVSLCSTNTTPLVIQSSLLTSGAKLTLPVSMLTSLSERTPLSLGNMSDAKGNTNPQAVPASHIPVRTRQEAKKLLAANTEASMDDGDSTSFEENVANTVSKTVTEKIGALMERKFTELHSTLDKLSSRVEDNTKRITETETGISGGEDRTSSLENKLAELEKKVKILTNRAEDSENRSRRDNIRIMGLKEGAEGNQAVRFFETWLPGTLGLETKRSSIKIDRAHRALGPPKKNYNRPVIIKLHNFSDKQWILAAVREKGEVTHQGDEIYIRQDLSPQVREAWRQFNGICERLIQRGLWFQMRYPASLYFTLNGEDYSFKNPREAEDFLSRSEMPNSLPPRNPSFRPRTYKTEEKLGGPGVLLFI